MSERKPLRSGENERKRIFIGDVQGCADELDALLERARKKLGGGFEAWFVGDLVNRGPCSLRVLERVRKLEANGRARLVLGNHEIALLQCWFGLRSPGPRDTTRAILEDRDAQDWIDWLRTRPVAVVDAIGDEPFVMVHASVHPDWSLERIEKRARRVQKRLGHPEARECRVLLENTQVPEGGGDREADALGRFTRCRSVSHGGDRWSSGEPDHRDAGGDRVAWHAEWSKRAHGYGVVYGHWAMQLLHVAPWLRGLDTGCVHHGRGHDGLLTGWLADQPRADERAFEVPDDRFLQQKARRAYYAD